MAIDSQRGARVQRALPDDTWLGPVLVAHGVLTPRQEERLRARDGHSLWAAAVRDGASDQAIVAAVSRAHRVAAADLRSVLRQDPDIVLVGEIRDFETATTAVQAGFSGPFVLSTLHTNDAPSAVVRPRDMGIEAFKVAAVLKGVVAQRLVRKLCPACAEPCRPIPFPPTRVRPPDGASPSSGAWWAVAPARESAIADARRSSR